MLRRSGYDSSRPVRLIECDTTSNDFAKQLIQDKIEEAVDPHV